MKYPRSYSGKIALCGMLGALSVAVMLLGAVIPLAMFIAPAVASLLVMVVCTECGRRLAWTEYAAVSLLAVLFVPDKEVAMVFLFLGYYPLVKPRFDRLRFRALHTAAILVYFNASVLAMYALLYGLFFPGQLASELAGAGLTLAAATLLVGNIAFLLFDRALENLLRLYCRVWRSRLRRMLGLR